MNASGFAARTSRQETEVAADFAAAEHDRQIVLDLARHQDASRPGRHLDLRAAVGEVVFGDRRAPRAARRGAALATSSAGPNSASPSRISRSLAPRGSKYIPRESKTSEAGGRKSEPRPTERINPSSTLISETPACSAVAARSSGRRDAQPAIARAGAVRSRSAAATAPAAVRRNTGSPAEEQTKSAIRRRFQNDIPTQTAMRRLASSSRRHSARVASTSSKLALMLRNGSR